MENKLKHLFVAFFIFISFFSYSQDSSDYRFFYSEDNDPTFIQTIKWEGSQYALKYHFVLRNSQNKILVDKEVTTAFIELSLGFGRYQFQISTYNILGQIENITPWKEIIIKKAIIPKIDNLSPGQVFLEEWDGDDFVVYGTNFESDAKVYQTMLATKKEIPISKIENNRISFSIKKNEVLTGNTSIRVENPGKIYAVTPLSVKYKKLVDFLLAINWAPGIHTKKSNYENVILGGTLDFTGLPEGFLNPTASVFNPIDFGLEAVLYPYKSQNGNFGFGLNANYKKFNYKEDITTLDNESLDFELMLYYKILMDKHAAFYLRAGAGVVLFSSQFMYNDENIVLTEDKTAGGIAPVVKAGLGLQILPYKGISLLIGLDYKAYLFKDYNKATDEGEGRTAAKADFFFLQPSIGIGYQF